MKLIELIKSEFDNFGRYERIIFPLVLVLIAILSFATKDNKIALVSAVCGISYTILAGKGKVSCYYIGITGTICYSYLAFINGFFGNLALYALYYLPMQITGIFKWRKNLKENAKEIKKTRLTKRELILYSFATVLLSVILTIIFYHTGDKNPVADAFTTVFSITGLLLTVKRCIEQWYIWIIVNVLSFIMWIGAYLNTLDCLSTVLMWFVYSVLSFYFLIVWRKEMA